MRTIDLDHNYDIYVQNNDLAIQRNALETIRQTIVNKLSLVKGETPRTLTNGLDLDIIFGDNVSYESKVAEIRRVIMLESSVESIDNIEFTVDRKLRVGYFKCYITVSVEGTSQQTTIGFGV